MAVKRTEPKRQILLVKTFNSSLVDNPREVVGKSEALVSRASRDAKPRNTSAVTENSSRNR